MRSVVVLPQPEGSEQSDELAGSDPQVDARDRDETTEGTRDIFENEF